MNKNKKIAGALMLGATSLNLAGNMTTSAGLFDLFKRTEAKQREQDKQKQGLSTAKKVAVSFLRYFDNTENKKKEVYNNIFECISGSDNNVLKILEELILKKAAKKDATEYYQKKIDALMETFELKNKEDIEGTKVALKALHEEEIVDEKNEEKNDGNNNIENAPKREGEVKEKKGQKEEVEKKNLTKALCSKIAQGASAAFEKVKEGASIVSTKVRNLFGNRETWEVEVGKNLSPFTIKAKSLKDLANIVNEFQKGVLERVNENKKNSEAENKKKYIEHRKKMINEVMNIKSVSYKTIINTLFKNLKKEKNSIFTGNNPLTEIIWSDGHISILNNEVLDEKDKAILHELGYEKSNSSFVKLSRIVASMVVSSVAVFGITAAFPVVAGVLAAPLGCILSGVISTVIDRVAFKTRFKEYRKLESWNPNNWEVQRFLKDTAINTIQSTSIFIGATVALKNATNFKFL